MKRAYSIPVTAFKIGDLSGSDLAVVAVIHVAWPNRVRRRNLRPPRARGTSSGAPATAGFACGDLHYSTRPCQHIKDLALGLESDLSSDMAVGDQELDAITRLLGDALDELLIGS